MGRHIYQSHGVFGIVLHYPVLFRCGSMSVYQGVFLPGFFAHLGGYVPQTASSAKNQLSPLGPALASDKPGSEHRVLVRCFGHIWIY